jgi:cytochrome P450
MAATLKRSALEAAGQVARYVPLDKVQLFAFIASSAVRSDPWALYRRLHERGAIRQGPYGAWLIGSHSGATQVLRHAATSVDESLAAGLPASDRTKPFPALMRRTLLFTDPPDHARLRRLVSRAFTPRTVEGLRPRIEALVEARLDELCPAGEADLLSAFALPLPVAVICELFGVPEGDRARFLGWARHLAPPLDISLFRDAEKERLGDEAAIEIVAFLEELVGDASRRDPEGLLAALVAAEEEGDRLDRDEVVALCALLLAAGFETTSNLVCNGLLALLRHPDQLARLRDGSVDPAIAVEELLRYDGPVQLTLRVLLEDIEIDGHRLSGRSVVAVLIGAANRDPSVFDEPDRLDLHRDPNPHLAFSSGIHYCLGAALARLEAAIAIPAVLRSLPELHLASRPRWRDTYVLRGLRSLPVSWRA